MVKNFIINTEKDMEKLASSLAKTAFAGEFIALFGGLGAGKTTLVRYFAGELGMDTAASPTFTIVRHYAAGRFSIAHFDCYRLADSDELLAIGFEDYLDSDEIKLMEWSENVEDALPTSRLEIHIEGSGSDPRSIEVSSFGEDYDIIAGALSLC